MASNIFDGPFNNSLTNGPMGVGQDMIDQMTAMRRINNSMKNIWNGPTTVSTPPITPFYQLAVRMGWSHGAMSHPFQFCECAKDTTGRVHIFIVHKDQPVTITDDSGMFPCDATVASIRMLTP